MDRTAIVLCTLLIAPSFALAQERAFEPAAFVKQLHQRYIGRDPSAEESRYWVDRLARGASPDEVHAGVLGSEAYYNRHKRDAGSFVDGAFAMVQSRTPTTVEHDAWVARLTQLGGDRIRWASEFLAASGAAQPPIVSQPPSTGGGITSADRLVTTTRLLSEAAAAELPGTRNWLVKVQATNLEASAVSYRGTLSDPARDPVAARTAQANLARSVESLRAALTQSQANAPNTRFYLAQASDLVDAIGATLSGGAVAKPPVSPIVSGYDAATVARIDAGLVELAAQSHETALLTRTSALRDYNYVRLQNQLDAFAGQVDAARNRLRGGSTRADVQANLASLRTQASIVTGDLQKAGVDGRVTSAWYRAVNVLDDVCAVAGLSGPLVPSQPSRPDWSDPVSTDWARSRRIQDAVAAVQAECDALIAAVSPYAFQSFHVQSMQDELRSLRSSMDAVNRTAAAGGSAQELWERVAESNGDYAHAKTYWNKATATSGLRGLPSLDRLSQALNRLTAAATGN